MKKISLIILLACLSVAASSQSLIPIKYGIKVGVNSSSLSISTIEGVKKPTINSSQIGISAGACIHIPLSDKWYINPEVLYSQRGGKFEYEFTHNYEVNERDQYETNNQLTLSYVEVNPTISFKASNKLALNFGPAISLLIGEEYTYSQNPIRDPLGISDNTNRFMKAENLDIGLNLGFSYFISEKFLVDARVYTGFMKAAEVIQPYVAVTDNTPPLPAYTLKSRAIVFSLAYLF